MVANFIWDESFNNFHSGQFHTIHTKMLTLRNAAIDRSAAGTDSFASVSDSLGWKQYHRFRPRAGMTVEQDRGCLDLAAYKPQSRRYRSFDEFRGSHDLSYDLQKIPIAVMGYKNEADKKSAVARARPPGSHKPAPVACSASTGYSFLGGVTFGSLMRAYSLVDPKQMWMCAMVAENAPVHLYFDFDASTAAAAAPSSQHMAAQQLGLRVQGQEAAVKLEFVQMFSLFFEQIYHRQPNWTGLHWETASDRDAGKFSLHAHLITEAFVDIQHMGRFIKGFAAFLDQQYKQGTVQWLLHHDDAGGARASLLDTAVYTPNRVFRLIGCRKPGKAQLIPCPSTPEEANLSLEELVFRGMPSLSIDVDDAHLVQFGIQPAVLPKEPKKRKAPGTSTAVTGSEACPDRVRAILESVCIGLFEIGPCVRVQRCQTIRIRSASGSDINRRYEGEFVLGSAWCPNLTKIDASTLSAAPHMHKNTAIAFAITMQWITIMDFRCGIEKKKRFAPDLERSGISVQEWRSIFIDPVVVCEETTAVAEPAVESGQTPAPIVMIDSLDFDFVGASPDVETRSDASSTAERPISSDAVTYELEPSLNSIRQIIARYNADQASALQELTLKMRLATSHGDAHAAAQCEDAAAAMQAALVTEVVHYCNRFWGKFLRLGKPWMVQELGKVSGTESNAQVRFVPTFNSLKHLEELYSDLNVVLPSFNVRDTTHVRRRGNQPAQSNVAAVWLTHPASRKLNGIEFNPQRDVTAFRTTPATSGSTCDYNLWRGFAIPEEAAAHYARRTVPETMDHDAACALMLQQMTALARPILDHILNVWCRRDERSYHYVMGWMANVVQKRGKNGTALVVKGPEGAGKGVVVEKLGEIIGRDHFFHAHNIEDVLGLYTHNIRSACVVFLDEVTYGGNHEQAQRCKKLVTESTHINNAKFQPSFTVDSYVNVLMASNDDRVIPCGTQQRRYFLMEVDDTHCGRQDERLKAYYAAILQVPSEAFAYVLYTYDLSGFNPRAIHSTDFERDQKIRSFQPMMAWWHDCLQEDEIESTRPIDPANAGADAAMRTSAFGALVIKDSVYDSFTAFCTRNRRGNTYQVTAKNEFWRLLDVWTQTSERKQLGVRLTLPEMKRQVERMGQRQWARVVMMPSLEDCRRAWKTQVVRDEDWTFKISS